MGAQVQIMVLEENPPQQGLKHFMNESVVKEAKGLRGKSTTTRIETAMRIRMCNKQISLRGKSTTTRIETQDQD